MSRARDAVPKSLRKTLKFKGKRCNCGNPCSDGYYECRLCQVSKQKKKRYITHHRSKCE